MEEAASSSNDGYPTGTTPEHCQRMINHSLSRYPTVKFVREALAKAGCPVSDKFFKPEHCSMHVGGGFKQEGGMKPGPWKSFTGKGDCMANILCRVALSLAMAHVTLQYSQVVICSNNVTHQDEVDVALTHELLHAYDHCRAANLDWTNCEHDACSEIRAANLSGDCAWNRELLRGYTNIQKQHHICVRRRALISVGSNPHCSMHRAITAIDRVWKTCYNDTQPSVRIP